MKSRHAPRRGINTQADTLIEIRHNLEVLNAEAKELSVEVGQTPRARQVESGIEITLRQFDKIIGEFLAVSREASTDDEEEMETLPCALSNGLIAHNPHNWSLTKADGGNWYRCPGMQPYSCGSNYCDDPACTDDHPERL